MRGAGVKATKLSPPKTKADRATRATPPKTKADEKPIDIPDLAVLTKKTTKATTRERFTWKRCVAVLARARLGQASKTHFTSS
eukprot:3236930-Pyramimonas_sp.AAC.1